MWPPTDPLRPVIPNNASPPRITAAAGTELAGAFSRGTVRPDTYSLPGFSSLATGVYDPRAFILHAASLRQAFAHCAKFPTAASRRSLGRVSVPVWPIALSGRLPIVALVGHYPTNKLMGRGSLHRRLLSRRGNLSFGAPKCSEANAVLAPVSRCYSPPKGTLPTRYSPVRRFTRSPKGTFSLDLHVLGTPPAFILSQDQTLQFDYLTRTVLAVVLVRTLFSFQRTGAYDGVPSARSPPPGGGLRTTPLTGAARVSVREPQAQETEARF